MIEDNTTFVPARLDEYAVIEEMRVAAIVVLAARNGGTLTYSKADWEAAVQLFGPILTQEFKADTETVTFTLERDKPEYREGVSYIRTPGNPESR